MKISELKNKFLTHVLPRAGVIFIITGIIIYVSPFAYNAYLRHQAADTARKLKAEMEAYEETGNEKEVTLPQPLSPQPLPENLVPDTGILVIPAIELEVVVNYGIEEEELKKGPGFYPQSGYPDHGNVCIAAHRGVHGAPFLHIDKLEAGDEIFLYYRGKKYTYTFQERFITHSTDWSVIDPTPEPMLTLTTCPLTNYRERRIIVRSTLTGVAHLTSVSSQPALNLPPR